MIGALLCWLGLHSWHSHELDAEAEAWVATRTFVLVLHCPRCGDYRVVQIDVEGL